MSNSIHKFFKRENHSTFTRRECESALRDFEQLMKLPLEKFSVKGIAVGLNIRVNDSPENYLPVPISYRGKKFREYPPQQGNRIIERICNGGEMSLKFYDKSAQFYQTEKVRLYSPLIFRFETVVTRMRYLHRKLNRARLTAKELFSEPFISAMAKNQLQLFETIDKKIEMDLSKLTPEEIKIISIMESEDLKKGLKEFHPHTFKKDRVKYLKLKNKLQFSDSKVKELREKFRDEAEKILSN